MKSQLWLMYIGGIIINNKILGHLDECDTNNYYTINQVHILHL